MSATRWIAVLAATAALLAGCGGGSETTEATRAEPRAAEATREEPRAAEASREEPREPEARPGKREELNLGVDGAPGPQNVGVWMAERRGFLRKAGFDAWVRSPVGPYRPIPYLTEGSVDLTVSHLPEVVLARERGVPVVAVASLIPQPTAAMIWLKKSKIGGIADLKGKTIAIPGVSFQKLFLEAILARADLTLADVEVVNGGYELVPALASGRVDAAFGGSANVEGAELEARGLEPVVTGVQSYGIPAYDELVVIVRPDRLAGEPQAIRDILAAVKRGTAAAVEDPGEAVDVIADEDFESSRKEIEAGVKATLPLLSGAGRLSPERTDRLIAWMLEQGMIQRELPASELQTDDYLPVRPK
ncbi:MAG TPA: ABC transporter substrate-binding protein [Solirubrobacterales bacterium]|nr:ABC transporter substrate-binding protein [Solirubrobacterales bacterium]